MKNISTINYDEDSWGFGRGKRMQIENDYAKIYTGVRFGKTLGSPIGMMIKNKLCNN